MRIVIVVRIHWTDPKPELGQKRMSWSDVWEQKLPGTDPKQSMVRMRAKIRERSPEKYETFAEKEVMLWKSIPGYGQQTL